MVSEIWTLLNTLLAYIFYCKRLIYLLLLTLICYSSQANTSFDSSKLAYETRLVEANDKLFTSPQEAAVLYEEVVILFENLLRSPDFDARLIYHDQLKSKVDNEKTLEEKLEVIANKQEYKEESIIEAYQYVIQKIRLRGRDRTLIEYFFEAITYAEKNENIEAQISFLISLADYYTNTSQYSNAQKRFQEAKAQLDQHKEVSNSVRIVWNQRYANFQNFLQDHEEVIKYSLKAIELMSAEKESYTSYLATSYNEIAHAYFKENQNEKAIPYFLEAIRYFDSLQNYQNLGISQLNLARIYTENKAYEKAILTLNEALANILKGDINWASGECVSLLSRIYEAQQNFEMALVYERICRFHIYYVEKQKRLKESAKLEAEYELADNLKKIKQQETKILDISKKKEEQLLLAFIGGTFLILILGVVIIYSRKLRKKSAELQHQQEETQTKNMQLSDSLKQNQVLLKEVHHRVKNNLMTLSGIFYLHENEVKNPQERAFLDDCQNRIHNMAMIHQKLYESENMAEIKFEDYCKDLIQSIALSLARDKLEVEQKIKAEELYFEIDKAIPLALILTELTTNSFKYAFENRNNGIIGVTLNQIGKQIELVYFDDGQGLDEDFSISKSKTLGMRLIRILAEQIDADVTYSNSGRSEFKLIFSI